MMRLFRLALIALLTSIGTPALAQKLEMKR